MGRKKRQRRDRNCEDQQHDNDGITASICSCSDSGTIVGSKQSGVQVPEASVLSIANVLSNFDANDNCYHQVIRRFCQKDSDGDGDGDGNSDDNPDLLDSDPPLHWLNIIYTLSRSTTDTKASTNSNSDSTSSDLQIQLNQCQSQNQSQYQYQSQNEIQKLTNNLNSIKHLLWPAAIKTSQSKNRIASRKNRRKKRKKHDCSSNSSSSADNANTNGKGTANRNKNIADNTTSTESTLSSTSTSTPSSKLLPTAVQSKAKPIFTASPFTSPSMEFRHAREKCNPFEHLGNQKWLNLNHQSETNTKSKTTKKTGSDIDIDIETTISPKAFVCRSAMKLANIDAILGFVLTGTGGFGSRNTVRSDQTFKFVDLCGAPGGFSEYILLRLGASTSSFVSMNGNGGSKTDKDFCCCCGYGMSLIGSNDDGRGAKWDLDTLSQIISTHANEKDGSSSDDSSSKTKNSLMWKVCNGDDGTGDIYNFQNVIQLQNDIQHDHKQRTVEGDDATPSSNNGDWKVDLVVADGGFDAQRDSECQESLAHELVTCQTAAALSLLRKGGHFVIKMFGFQNARKLIIHQLYDSFEKLIFLKPVTSRPASAERYVVCLNFGGLDPSFDLLSWRDGVIKAEEKVATSQSITTGSDVDNVLHLVDRSMLQLNLQACAEIISVLRQEELLAGSNKDGARDEEPKDAIDFSFYHKYFQIEF